MPVHTRQCLSIEPLDLNPNSLLKFEYGTLVTINNEVFHGLKGSAVHTSLFSSPHLRTSKLYCKADKR